MPGARMPTARARQRTGRPYRLQSSAVSARDGNARLRRCPTGQSGGQPKASQRSEDTQGAGCGLAGLAPGAIRHPGTRDGLRQPTCPVQLGAFPLHRESASPHDRSNVRRPANRWCPPRLRLSKVPSPARECGPHTRTWRVIMPAPIAHAQHASTSAYGDAIVGFQTMPHEEACASLYLIRQALITRGTMGKYALSLQTTLSCSPFT